MTAALRREHFSISRASEYFRLGELQAQTGQPAQQFAHVALKELVDNGLDAAESAGVPPVITVEHQKTDDEIVLRVSDNGLGIPANVVERILDFSTRTSDKAAYRAPMRGAQGNAFKTLLGIPVALGAPRSCITIEGAGSLHQVEAWITPAGDVKTEHRVETGPDGGAKITVKIPSETVEWQPEAWVFGFAAMNPHASIQIREIGDRINQGKTGPSFSDLSFNPTEGDGWRKFWPHDPTPAHWYSAQEFATLAYLKADVDPSISVLAFVSEFKGMSRRAREVAQHFPARLSDVKSCAELHAAMKAAAEAPRPEVLGRVGPHHFRSVIEGRFGIVADRYWYRHRWAVTDDGMPFLLECAVAETEQEGGVLCGLNYSAPFGAANSFYRAPIVGADPLAGQHLRHGDISGEGVLGFLADAGVYNSGESHWRRPLRSVAAVHLVMPLLPSLDRGKSRISVPQDIARTAAEIMATAAKTMTAEHQRWKRQKHREISAYNSEQREERRAARSIQMSKTEAVTSVLMEAYMAATDNERLHVEARDLYYVVRPLYDQLDVKASKTARGESTELTFKYFSQTVLPEFRRTRHELPMIDYKARGWLFLPHSEKQFQIGDKELRELVLPEDEFNKILFIEKNGVWKTLRQTGGIDLAKRMDMAILAGEGYSTVAIRKLLAKQNAAGTQALVWHDADASGYDIARTLSEETKRMPDHRLDVFDIGLHLGDALSMGLQKEGFTRKKAIPAAVLERLTPKEKELFVGERITRGADKEEWRSYRVEINAIPVLERVDYLERRFKKIEGLQGKVIPSKDRLPKLAQISFDTHLTMKIEDEIARQIDLKTVARKTLELIERPKVYHDGLHDALAEQLNQTPLMTWRSALQSIFAEKAIDKDTISKAVAQAIAEVIGRGGAE